MSERKPPLSPISAADDGNDVFTRMTLASKQEQSESVSGGREG